MVSTGFGVSGTWKINPVPKKCSCKNVVKSDETIIKEDNFLGSSSIGFDEQWTITADVNLNDLSNSETKRLSLLEVSIKKVHDFRQSF